MEGNWSWVEMCGPGGLVPWYPSKRDIGSCFQQLFLLVPVSIIFAIVSAYYCGAKSDRTRYQNRKCIIQSRFTVSLLIAIIPVIRFIVGSQYAFEMFRPVDYLTAGVEIIAWFVHSGYVLSLRHENKIHGPVIVRVLWTLLVILAVINLRSQILTSHSNDDFVYHVKFGFSFTLVFLQICYGLTFFFSCGSSQSSYQMYDRYSRYTERSRLLTSTTFHGFVEDVDSEDLGVAMENESFTSKLIFHWVYFLMKKGFVFLFTSSFFFICTKKLIFFIYFYSGSEKKLKTCDDLFDLPSEMNSFYLRTKMNSAMGVVPKPEDITVYGSTDVSILPKPEKITLLKALHKCFKFEFYSIGVLKLCSDVLNFGGPLLLNRLVTFIESKEEKLDTGLYCAFGLFLTTFFGALTNVHFNFFMTKVGLKLRGALIGTIYSKTLNTVYLDINKFSTGEIINFMSVDTERVVNSCASFHSLWSIPLQVEKI